MDEFEDDRARERARRVVEYVGISGIGALASRTGHLRIASGDHPALAAAIEKVASAWLEHPLAVLPSLGGGPSTHSATLGSAPGPVCIGACVDGVHVLAAPVDFHDLLVVLVANGTANTETRVRLRRAADLLERFSLAQTRPGPAGSGAAPATATVHVADGRPRQR